MKRVVVTKSDYWNFLKKLGNKRLILNFNGEKSVGDVFVLSNILADLKKLNKEIIGTIDAGNEKFELVMVA